MPDVLDLLTTAEAHDAINVDIADTAHDTELGRAVTAISRRIDDVCGPVVVRAVTEEHTTLPVILRQWPVYSITTISEWSAGTETALTAETTSTAGTYRADLNTGIVAKRASWADTNWTTGAIIVVTYQAGRYPTTGVVDSKFKQAAAAILNRLWKREAGAWAQAPDTFMGPESTPGIGFYRVVDPMIDEFLGFERKPPAVA